MERISCWIRTLASGIVSETFAMCLLAAFAAAAVLAFGFGADADLIVIIPGLGVATASVETAIRFRK